MTESAKSDPQKTPKSTVDSSGTQVLKKTEVLKKVSVALNECIDLSISILQKLEFKKESKNRLLRYKQKGKLIKALSSLKVHGNNTEKILILIAIMYPNININEDLQKFNYKIQVIKELIEMNKVIFSQLKIQNLQFSEAKRIMKVFLDSLSKNDETLLDESFRNLIELFKKTLNADLSKLPLSQTSISLNSTLSQPSSTLPTPAEQVSVDEQKLKELAELLKKNSILRPLQLPVLSVQKQLEQNLSAAQKSLLSFQERIKELQQFIDKINKELLESENELKKNQAELKKLEAETKQYEEKISELEREKKKLEEKNKKLLKEKDEALKAKDKASHSFEEATKKFAEEREALEQQVEELKKQAEEKTKEIEKLKKQNEELNNQIQQQEKKIENLTTLMQGQLKKLEQEKEMERKKSEVQIKQYQEEKEKLAAENERLRKELELFKQQEKKRKEEVEKEQKLLRQTQEELKKQLQIEKLIADIVFNTFKNYNFSNIFRGIYIDNLSDYIFKFCENFKKDKILLNLTELPLIDAQNAIQEQQKLRKEVYDKLNVLDLEIEDPILIQTISLLKDGLVETKDSEKPEPPSEPQRITPPSLQLLTPPPTDTSTSSKQQIPLTKQLETQTAEQQSGNRPRLRIVRTHP